MFSKKKDDFAMAIAPFLKSILDYEDNIAPKVQRLKKRYPNVPNKLLRWVIEGYITLECAKRNTVNSKGVD